MLDLCSTYCDDSVLIRSNLCNCFTVTPPARVIADVEDDDLDLQIVSMTRPRTRSSTAVVQGI